MFSMKLCDCETSEEPGVYVSHNSLSLQNSGIHGTLEVTPPENGILFCSYCNSPYISKEEARELIKKAVEKKQKEKGFLTGKEIFSIRKELQMTLKEFAEATGINWGSLSSIENGYNIQSKRADENIRTKTETIIKRRAPERRRVKNLFKLLMKEVGTSKLFLNKILFYIDFLSLKRNKKSITGSEYIPMQYGPCPRDYYNIIQEMIDDSEIKPIYGHRFRVIKETDINQYSNEGREIISDVISLCKKDDGRKLYDLSHEEKGFIETPLYTTIPWKYANDLKIEELLDEIVRK